MADVYLYQTPDDGEISIENGTVELQESPSSAAYISLFGGNVNGSAWWGDEGMVSATQEFIDKYSPTSGNLRKLEDAVKSDLAWMRQEPYGWDVDASASMESVNRVNIVTTINGTVYQYSQEWTK